MAFVVAAAPAAASDVVISQFRTQGTGGDFVEIQNVTNPPHTVNLGFDWSISWNDAVFSGGCTIYGDYTNPSSIPAFNAFRPPVSLAPGQRFLVTQPSGWTGTGDAATDESFHSQAHASDCGDVPNSGFINFNPGVDSVTGVSLAADQIAYGAIPGVPPTAPDPFWGSSASYVSEPDPIAAASIPSDGRALRRKVGGTQDSNSNKNDFEAVTADPRNSIATAPAPDAATTDASSIAARTATLNGTVNPHRAAVTDYKFQIDTTGTYTSPAVVPCAPTTPVGQTDLPVTGAAGAATALVPDTVYHYRVVVTT